MLTGRMGGFRKEKRGFSRHWIGEQVRGDGVGDRNLERESCKLLSVSLHPPLEVSKCKNNTPALLFSPAKV